MAIRNAVRVVPIGSPQELEYIMEGYIRTSTLNNDDGSAWAVMKKSRDIVERATHVYIKTGNGSTHKVVKKNHFNKELFEV